MTAAAPLNADQLNAIASETGYTGGPFSSEGLSPAIPVDSLNTKVQAPPSLPANPTANPNYALQTQGLNGMIAGNTAAITMPPVSTPTIPTPNATTTASPIMDYVKSLVGIQPPSATDTYNTDETNANISTLQNNVNTNQQDVVDAQNNLATLTAQLNGINGGATSKNLSLENEGGAITTTGVATSSAENIRDAAIQAIPLQTQILGAQAKVAAAQGNATLSQQILTQAQDQVDKVFQLQTNDATQQYNYQKSIIDTYYSYATTEQQTALDALKTKQAQDFTTQQNNLNEGQSLANEAISNGEAGIAGKILALDPTSSTYLADLAKLSSQITSKATATSTSTGNTPATAAERQTASVANFTAAFVPGAKLPDGTPVIDQNGFITPVAWKQAVADAPAEGISRTDFIKQFGYLLYSTNGVIDPSYGLTAVEQKLI